MRFKSEIPVRAMAGSLLVVMLSACDAPQEKAALPPPFAGQRGAPLTEVAASRSGVASLTFPRNTATTAGMGTAPQDLLPRDLQSQRAAVTPAVAPKSASKSQVVDEGGMTAPRGGQSGQVVVAEALLIEGPAPVAAAKPASGKAAASAAVSGQTDKSTTDAAVTSSLPAAGTAIHLASYHAIDQARRGWAILSAAHAGLASLTPLYVDVDIPGKGHFLRLYGSGDNPAKLAEICRGLQTRGTYCAVSIGR